MRAGTILMDNIPPCAEMLEPMLQIREALLPQKKEDPLKELVQESEKLGLYNMPPLPKKEPS